MKIALVSLVFALVPLASLAQTIPDEVSIRTSREASNAAIAGGNAQGFAENLEANFVVVTGNGTLLTREAYVEAFARDFADPHSVRFERVIDSIDLSSSLPLAAEHGHWTGRVTGGPTLFSGTYLAMWRHSKEGWKLRSELFVSLSCRDKAACDSYRKKYKSLSDAPAQ